LRAFLAVIRPPRTAPCDPDGDTGRPCKSSTVPLAADLARRQRSKFRHVLRHDKVIKVHTDDTALRSLTPLRASARLRPLCGREHVQRCRLIRQSTLRLRGGRRRSPLGCETRTAVVALAHTHVLSFPSADGSTSGRGSLEAGLPKASENDAERGGAQDGDSDEYQAWRSGGGAERKNGRCEQR
jgi:hypothetical protein